MKLTTWNCARGFEKKKNLIFADAPDIAVIQECSRRSAELNLPDGYNADWVGANPNIGMAVFHRKQLWSIRRSEQTTHGIEWVVPFEVNGPENFRLIAVWACEVKESRRRSYVGQLNQAFQEHQQWFEDSPVILAGDFNSNACWDRERPDWNHSTLVKGLEKTGLISAYHTIWAEKHGGETIPTFYLQRNMEKKYHLDYIFAPSAWQHRMSITVGEKSEWLSHSDHCPLTLILH